MSGKKNKKSSGSDLYNFRAGSAEKKDELKTRTKVVTESNNVTQKEIYEDGLLVNEGRDDERTFLNKKYMKKAMLNDALDTVAEMNAVIMAYNRRLKNLNPSRYKFLDDEDGVVKLYDEHGNRIF